MPHMHFALATHTDTCARKQLKRAWWWCRRQLRVFAKISPTIQKKALPQIAKSTANRRSHLQIKFAKNWHKKRKHAKNTAQRILYLIVSVSISISASYVSVRFIFLWQIAWRQQIKYKKKLLVSFFDEFFAYEQHTHTHSTPAQLCKCI